MIDENSPEMQRALAPYHDSVAQFNRQVADRNAEAEEAHAKREKEFAETTSRQRAELGQILAERDAKRKQDQAGQARNPNDAWRSSSREPVQDLQFGLEGEDEYAQQPYQGYSQPAVPSAPSDPWSVPVANDPWSAPQPTPQPQAPPSRPPARHQRSSGYDDDDMSNESWLQ
ncbi:MAG TPA: hypothetical protein VGM75_18175 [Pseudonocardiaceae bacterium]